MSNMLKLVSRLAMSAVVLCAIACSAPDNDMTRIYKNSATASGKLAACHGQKPQLTTATDTVAYYMGYINGSGLGELIMSGQAPQEIVEMDRKKFMQGLSMAFAADSIDVSLLQGIATGIQLRQMRDALNQDVPMQWDNNLVMQGFYQGFMQDRTDHLPAQLAQEKLMQARYSIFMQNNTKE